MQHRIQAGNLGAEGPAMLEAIEACVHCGFCLPACPTYESLAEEMDSPRGRIFLMKEVLEAVSLFRRRLPTSTVVSVAWPVSPPAHPGWSTARSWLRFAPWR